MKLAITNDTGVMTVDGVARSIATSDLHPDIEVVVFDTDRNIGWIQYYESVTIQVEDRDLEAENLENKRRRENNLQILENPIMKMITVPKPPSRILSFAVVEPFLRRWEAAAPPPPPPPHVPTPEEVMEAERVEAIEADIRSASLGDAQPKTIPELKAMSRNEFNAWFNASFTTNAQLVRLLRRLTLIIIRKLL